MKVKKRCFWTLFEWNLLSVIFVGTFVSAFVRLFAHSTAARVRNFSALQPKQRKESKIGFDEEKKTVNQFKVNKNETNKREKNEHNKIKGIDSMHSISCIRSDAFSRYTISCSAILSLDLFEAHFMHVLIEFRNRPVVALPFSYVCVCLIFWDRELLSIWNAAHTRFLRQLHFNRMIV